VPPLLGDENATEISTPSSRTLPKDRAVENTSAMKRSTVFVFALALIEYLWINSRRLNRFATDIFRQFLTSSTLVAKKINWIWCTPLQWRPEKIAAKVVPGTRTIDSGKKDSSESELPGSGGGDGF
jgi:hypothetical protein